MELVKFLNENIVWGIPMLILFALCGIIFTVRIKFGQVLGFKDIVKSMLVKGEDKGINPFSALTAALGTTLGTGNIIAVGTAIGVGGAGSVFWMWISAIIGMATAYGEVNLGMKYRRKTATGYKDAPFGYIRKAFGRAGGICAGFFALCCLFAAFGMGNMAQINSAAVIIKDSTGISPIIVGLVSGGIILTVAAGGINRLAKITSIAIPVVSFLYIFGCLYVIGMNIERLPRCIADIITGAFSLKGAAGGAIGGGMLLALQWGVKRGVFSNEAGLGSSVIIHTKTASKDGINQGKCAMLQVFIDTILMCSLTAFCILCSNSDNLTPEGGKMAYIAFESGLGDLGGIFLSLSIFIFAISTASGWWLYGKECFCYIFKNNGVKLYTAIYIILAIMGAIIKSEVVWELSDLFNGLMALPNLIALLRLRKEVEWK